MVGAVLQGALAVAGAQDPRPDTTRRADSVRVRGDTLVVPIPAGRDSLLDTLRVAEPDTLRDTLQAPVARAPFPAALEVGGARRWDRDALFASGAITVAELLALVPGVVTFSSGWIATPSVASHLGELGRVRVFLDGVALDVLDPRDSGVQDLGEIQLWMLEEVLVERGATEVRVHLRSWRTRHIVPETRTDVGTGDQRTNTFRGFYGKRWRNGAGLQVAAQQWGSNAEYQYGADGDELSLFTRAAWARGPWSVDGTLMTSRRSRSEQPSYLAGVEPVPGLDRTRGLAYLRAGVGDPESGLWAQLIASTQSVSSDFDDDDEWERTRGQYIANAGLTRWGVRLDATGRLRTGGGEEPDLSGGARAAWERSFLGVAALVERDGADSVDRGEVAARLTPFSWLTLAASAGRTIQERSAVAVVPGSIPDVVVSFDEEVTYGRAEAGLRIGDTWVGGGVLARSEARLAAATVFGDDFTTASDDEVVGVFATARGRVWRDIHVDAMVTAWDSASYYRPRFSTRTTLALVTRWLRRFPSGDFGLRLAVTHDYRSDVLFPALDGDRVAPGALERAIINNLISTQLEIRIADAVVYWQLRNIAGQYTEEVPGFVRPRQTNLYGIRWAFSN